MLTVLNLITLFGLYCLLIEFDKGILSTFINKVIRFGHIIYSISTTEVKFVKIRFLKYDIKLFSLLILKEFINLKKKS